MLRKIWLFISVRFCQSDSLCAKQKAESSHLRQGRTSAMMAEMGNLTCHYCFKLVRLAEDEGTIGQVLRANPNYKWMLPAADKWAEQTLERQLKKQNPNRLPFPDPWQFLIDAPAVSEIHKQTFRAAQSQLRALRKLSRIAHGEATLNTDWLLKMEKARHKREKLHALNKVAAARAQYKLFEKLILAPDTTPQFRQWAEETIQKSKAERRKRGKGKNVKPLPRGNEVRRQKLICALIDWWVRGPNNAPGLMSFRNNAATEFLKVYLGQKKLTSATVKKVRQQLGLVPVGNKKHFVWKYKATELGGSTLSIGRKENGKTAFWGTLHRSELAPKISPFGS